MNELVKLVLFVLEENSNEIRVQRFQGYGRWHYILVPKKESEELYGSVKKRGWGAVPVKATTGVTAWKTSVFPMKGKGYMFALKQAIRSRENISEDDMMSVTLKVL